MTDSTAPHVRIEYHPEFDRDAEIRPDFDGRQFAGVGRFALIPLDEVEERGVEEAFVRQVGLPVACMMHHTLDELYDADGNRLPEDAAEVGGPRL